MRSSARVAFRLGVWTAALAFTPLDVQMAVAQLG